MKTNRTVQQVIAPRDPHYVGDGFRVHNFIPSAYPLSMQRMDPFIMLDYNSPFYFPPSNTPRGVDVHPHKGFETVTIAYKGRVAHHDSAGNSGVIGEGDVQWMTAASGILHKEYHEESFSKAGGDFQMVQLWVNLPARDKLSPPGYQEITKDNIVKVPLQNNGGTVDIIAGEYNGQKGPARTFSPVHLFNARITAGSEAEFEFPKHFNTAVLTIEGGAVINGEQTIAANHFALMNNDGTSFSIRASENSVLLILSGEPLNEPIAAHGPFVMNTRQQLIEAFEEFQAGKFGVLN
jgi:quercetin 2,3-dioxygenase